MAEDNGLSARVESVLNRARDAKSIGSLLKSGVGGFFIAVLASMAKGAFSVADFLFNPFQGAARGLTSTAEAIFGGPGDIIDAGVQSTVQALTTTWRLGPLTFPAAVFVVVSGFAVLAWYREREDSGNVLSIVPIDLPFGEEENG